MRRFARFACIDWSGAATRWLPGIAIAVCDRSEAALRPAPRLERPPGRCWTRQAVLEWLRHRAADDLLIGVDFSLALPFDPEAGYLGVPGIGTAPELWRVVDDHCREDDHLGASSFLQRPDFRRYSRIGRETGAEFAYRPIDPNGRRRRVERETASGNAASCYNLVGAKQVGRSSLTGMRVLHRLCGSIPVWPFEEPRDSGAALVEIYTSIAACDAGRPKGRAKMDHLALNDALDTIGVEPFLTERELDDHQTDAILTAAWLRRRADDQECWTRPDDPVAMAEGWTFGVPYRKGARSRLSSAGRAADL